MKNVLTKELMEFIDSSPSMYHGAENIEKLVAEAGFVRLNQSENWGIKEGGKYYILNNNSAIIVFTIGKEVKNPRFNIVGSHSDSPTFKLKPNNIIRTKDSFLTVNVEPYGGAIYNTWFDRPLSVAGRVTFEKGGQIVEENVYIDKNILIIANAAIHMNREINKGYNYNEQKDMLPILGMIGSEDEPGDFILEQIAEKLKIKPEEILDFDLYLYDRQKGSFVGINDDFFSVGRIDNLGMAYLSVRAIIENSECIGADNINMACVFDNEEVGSGSRQGAASPFLKQTIQRIVSLFSDEKEAFYKAVSSSFLISADQAHSVHPNYLEYSDITNYPTINKGPVIKYAANQSYTSDAVSAAVIKAICKEKDIPVQAFVNRSDKRGGSTIGPITMGKLNIPSVDIGSPILSMHSVKELGGCLDQEYILELFTEFYKGKYSRPIY